MADKVYKSPLDQAKAHEETYDKEELKKERDELVAKFPYVKNEEFRRIIKIRDLLGDDEFYEGK